MITYVEGDLFTSPAQVLVNTVNTVGVMGKGIARQFKSIYPEMFKAYQVRCERGEFDIGQIMLYRTPHKLILNFPTKRHWRSPSQLAFIEAGLRTFQANYSAYGIYSVAFPQLGCGNGELRWEEDVRPLMEAYLGNLPIDVFVHIYSTGTNAPEHRVPVEIKRWLRAEPRALGFAEVWDDIHELLRRNEKLASSWTIASTEAGEQLAWHADGATLIIAKEELLDLWQKLRVTGYLAPADVAPLSPLAVDAFFALLGRLSYIDPIRLAVAPSGSAGRDMETSQLFDENGSHGLRLMSPIDEQPSPAIQPSLFSLSQI